jgi:hypothetical protein
MRATLLILALAFGPRTAEALDLPVTLNDGAIWIQTSVHSRTDTRKGIIHPMTATSVIKTTYRKDSGANTLRQDFVSFSVDGVGGEQLKALADQAKLIYPAVIEVDDALRPSRVREWDKMRETIFETVATQVPDARAVAAVRANYDKMDASQAAALFNEQSLVSLGQGTGLELGDTRRYEGETPNSLGGPPIKTSGSFRLESIDKAKGHAFIVWSQLPDPASLSASLKVSVDALIARAAPERQSEAKAQLANLVFERQESCRFEVDLPTGLAVTTDCTVNLKTGLQGQITERSDRWVITQTLPEAH